jgi:hypothetical protein
MMVFFEPVNIINRLTRVFARSVLELAEDTYKMNLTHDIR